LCSCLGSLQARATRRTRHRRSGPPSSTWVGSRAARRLRIVGHADAEARADRAAECTATSSRGQDGEPRGLTFHLIVPIATSSLSMVRGRQGGGAVGRWLDGRWDGCDGGQ
jgi:hypothetical protein